MCKFLPEYPSLNSSVADVDILVRDKSDEDDEDEEEDRKKDDGDDEDDEDSDDGYSE